MKGQYGKLHKRGISLLMAAVCAGALMSGCGQVEEEETMSDVIPVLVQQPESGTLTLKNEFVGTVTPEESVYVISMVSAEVISNNVSVGDIVSAGDVLCQLDSEAAELQLASAQVQYDSAAAGANAAQVGYEAAQFQYEMAQSQYESTVAQLDAQMWGQKNLQMYQLQAQVESIEASIDSINKQKEDLAAQKAAAQKRFEELVEYTKQMQAGLPSGTDALEDQTEIVQEQSDSALEDENAVVLPSGNPSSVEDTLKEIQSLQSTIATIESSQKQLDSALEDANRGLEQAQTIMNITQDQIYADTQKIVDANKETAALSMDSAALGIDSAASSVNSARIGIEGAQIAIDSAEYQLDMYTLKAPISGVIEAVNVKEHDFATPSSPAYIISNKDTMTVTFYVSEGIRNTLSVGQQVSADRNGKLYDAVITEIGSMIDQTTGLFAIKACIGIPDESLLTGCSVKITADTYSQDKVLLIPYDAVYYDDSQPYVYVAVNNVVERRNIETGIFDEQTITVISGLTVEDQLITSWSANLREGALVSIQSQGSAANSAAAGEE